jgi:uncharacterized damage-inducible protein DinB
MSAPLEPWLRGPVPGVAPLFQPAAHILLQVGEEVRAVVSGLTPDQLWARPAGLAPVGFHALHLAGALDRLFTYARGETLTEAQQQQIADEKAAAEAKPAAEAILATLDRAIAAAVAQLAATTEADALVPRALGRARIPTNALGLMMHAVEHSARHAGQIATLARVVRRS